MTVEPIPPSVWQNPFFLGAFGLTMGLAAVLFLLAYLFFKMKSTSGEAGNFKEVNAKLEGIETRLRTLEEYIRNLIFKTPVERP